MNIFKKLKSSLGYTATNKVVTKEAEYQLYEKVSQDIAEGKKDKGVWTLAFAKSEGDTQKADAKYIELMVQRYKDWIEAGKEMSEILETAFEEQQKWKEKEQEEKIARAREEIEEIARAREEIEKRKLVGNELGALFWYTLIVVISLSIFLVFFATQL